MEINARIVCLPSEVRTLGPHKKRNGANNYKATRGCKLK